MKILLALLLSVGLCKADFFGDGNQNTMRGWNNAAVNSTTNTMNILSNSITIAVWLRIRDTGTGLEQKNVFFCKGRLDFTALCNYLVRISGSKLQFNYTDQIGGLHTYQTDNTFVWTNRTRFVAITYTFTQPSSMQMYIDGAPVSGSWTAGNGNSNNLPGAEHFCISGPTAQSVGGGIIMGEEGPVMAWTTNLTSTYIKMLYDSKVHGLPYMIEPTKCILNITWDTINFRAQDNPIIGNPRGLYPDRSKFRNHVAVVPGNAAPIKGTGNRIFSFVPNE